MACGSCNKNNSQGTKQATNVEVVKIIKTTVADADVLIDSNGRRYIRKK